jgi:hypothetical protein
MTVSLGALPEEAVNTKSNIFGGLALGRAALPIKLNRT